MFLALFIPFFIVNNKLHSSVISEHYVWLDFDVQEVKAATNNVMTAMGFLYIYFMLYLVENLINIMIWTIKKC